MDGLLGIFQSRDTFVSVKSDKNTPDDSRVKLEEYLRTNHTALSTEKDNVKFNKGNS